MIHERIHERIYKEYMKFIEEFIKEPSNLYLGFQENEELVQDLLYLQKISFSDDRIKYMNMSVYIVDARNHLEVK